jgi:putative ABC transport system permease protein
VNLLIGSATMGFILAPLALGAFISYRVYQTLDLTTDGSFGVGVAVVAALLVSGVSPLTATLLGALAGVLAGAITGVVHTKFRVRVLLAGVLTTTALYSVDMFVMGGGNLPLANTESLVSAAERVGEQVFGIPSSLTILGTSVSGGSLSTLAMMGALASGLSLALGLFLGTDLGLAMRAAGNNPRMAKAVSIDVDWMVILGLGLSNGLIALSGALLAQYEGFANIQMGFGAVVTAVATLMVGEALFGKRPLGRWIAGVVAGSVGFRLLVALAIRAGLHPNALKLVTAAFVLTVLVIPELARAARRRAMASEARHA